MARGQNTAHDPRRQPQRPWSGSEPVVGTLRGTSGDPGAPGHQLYLSAEATGGGETDSLTFPHHGRMGGYQDLVGKSITMKPGLNRGTWGLESYDPASQGRYHGAPPPT